MAECWAGGARTGRAWGSLVSVATLALMVWPVSWPREQDSFPLSPYRMFSRNVAVGTFTPLVRAVAIDAAGAEHRLHPRFVANGEIMLAYTTLRQAAYAGRRERRRLCRHIASRIGEEQARGRLDASWRWAAITWGRYDPVAYFEARAQGALPQAQDYRILTRCKVILPKSVAERSEGERARPVATKICTRLSAKRTSSSNTGRGGVPHTTSSTSRSEDRTQAAISTVCSRIGRHA